MTGRLACTVGFFDMKLRVTPSRRRQMDHCVLVGAAAAGTTAVRSRRTAPPSLPASSSTTGGHTGGGPGHSKTLYLVPSVLTSEDSRRALSSSSLASAKDIPARIPQVFQESAGRMYILLATCHRKCQQRRSRLSSPVSYDLVACIALWYDPVAYAPLRIVVVQRHSPMR